MDVNSRGCMPAASDREPLMERLPHPTYVRRTAAVTYGLIVGGLACLALGFVVRQTAWRDAETILNVLFVGAAVALVIRWFTVGEAVACPRCGLMLSADPRADDREPLSFTCTACEVQWEAQTPADT
jgi:hypothetical protein